MLEDPLLIPCLLLALVVLQLFLLAMQLRLLGRVSRLLRLLASPMPPTIREVADRKDANGDQKKWFAQFLAEDPARKELSKKEQFAAFRRWREERGMNWKGPVESE